jgi:acetylglutamate kinase
MHSARVDSIVIKVGGSRLESDSDLDQLAGYVQKLRESGRGMIVVHGGGPEISRLHEAMSVPFEKRDGLRVTTDRGMELTSMALCGAVNTRVVAHLVARGLPALGLSGLDRGMLRAELKGEDLWGRVGTAPRVDTDLLESLLADGAIPVVSPVSLGPDGRAVNVNADEAAHALAESLAAVSLELVSDVEGVRIDDETVARRISSEETDELIASRVVRGGMVPKLRAAVAALDAGVGRVRIGDLAGMIANTATEVTATQ